MILKKLEVNVGLPEPTNCYIVADENTKEGMIIDPGGEPEKIIEMCHILDITIKYILLTHCHGDHIGAVEEVRKNVGGKVLIHRTEEEGLYNEQISLTYVIGMPVIELEADSRLDDEDLIHVGELEFQIIHTPGHTRGGICVYCKEQNLLFSGDTVFKGTWGRTDLPTGNFEDIIKSITHKIMILPEATILYPGHGKASIVKEEEKIYLDLKPNIY